MRGLGHKFSVGNLHPDPQLMKMLRQAAPKMKISTDSDESGDDEPAIMIKKISATPKWNAFGKVPLLNIQKKSYLVHGKAHHLVFIFNHIQGYNVKDDNFSEMPRGYHSKMTSVEYASDGEM